LKTKGVFSSLLTAVWGSGYDLDVKIRLWTWSKTGKAQADFASVDEAGTTKNALSGTFDVAEEDN
jgi:hypothetical protein